MQLAAFPKLLPPPEMAHATPYDTACEVQGRPLARLGQQGDRILVSSSAGVHMALLGDFFMHSIHDGLRGAYRCIARLFRG